MKSPIITRGAHEKALAAVRQEMEDRFRRERAALATDRETALHEATRAVEEIEMRAVRIRMGMDNEAPVPCYRLDLRLDGNMFGGLSRLGLETLADHTARRVRSEILRYRFVQGPAC